MLDIMMFVYYAVTFVVLLVMLLGAYPQVVDSSIDALFSWIERLLDRWDDASQNRLRAQIEYEEQRIAQLSEKLTALEWFRVALVTLPIDYPRR
jgi:hypothetical protein